MGSMQMSFVGWGIAFGNERSCVSIRVATYLPAVLIGTSFVVDGAENTLILRNPSSKVKDV